MSDMDVSEDEGVIVDIEPPKLKREQTVDYLQVAAEYRRNNWNTPSQPFHNAFLAATKQDTQKAYTSAFQPRSGGFKSLFVDTTEKEKEKDEIVVLKKSETEHLSPTSKARVLWDNF
jgi:hypothetical protein